MTQLDLFNSSTNEAFLTASVENASTHKANLGDAWLNTHYKWIQLYTKCVVCGTSNSFKSVQIFTDAEMLQKGWTETKPFTWLATIHSGCSRQCELKLKTEDGKNHKF